MDKSKRMTRKKWRIIVWKKKKMWNDKMETKMDTLSITSGKKTVETSSVHNEETVHAKFITPRTD